MVSLLQLALGVVLRQHALERRVLPLDGLHRRVDPRADVGLLGRLAQVFPAVAFRDPEDAFGGVLVAVLEDRLLRRFVGHEVVRARVVDQTGQLVVADHEGVGDVLEEDQPEDDVLVLGGVHLPAELIGRVPQRGFEALGRSGWLLRLRPLIEGGCRWFGHIGRTGNLKLASDGASATAAECDLACRKQQRLAASKRWTLFQPSSDRARWFPMVLPSSGRTSHKLAASTDVLVRRTRPPSGWR